MTKNFLVMVSTGTAQAFQDRELVYITRYKEENGKSVYAPYSPFLGAWFKYR